MSLPRKMPTYDTLPTGLHIARCFGMLEIGSVQSTFNGKTSINPKAIAQFEILDWHDSYGNTPVVNHFYTVSGHPKAKLRQAMEMLNGKSFTDTELDVINASWMVGQYCMINISHVEANGFVNPKITAVLAVPPSTVLPDPVNVDQVFSVTTPDLSVFNELPIWVKRMIKSSPEWNDFPRSNGWEIHLDNPPEAANQPQF